MEKKLRCLFIYVNPLVRVSPVAPFGIERLCSLVEIRFHSIIEWQIIAPFLFRDWKKRLSNIITLFDPNIIFLSFRNLDDGVAIIQGKVASRSFITYLKKVVEVIRRQYQGILIVGGSGFSSAPVEILDFCNIDYGVIGQGEEALLQILSNAIKYGVEKAVESCVGKWGLISRFDGGFPEIALSSATLNLPTIVRHPAFLEIAKKINDRIPVLCSWGCSRRCIYCVEPFFSSGKVFTRDTDVIVDEIETLVRQGIKKIWLSASELNQPTSTFMKRVFSKLAKKKLHLDIRGYMIAGLIDGELLDVMEDCGIKPHEWSFEFGHLDAEILQRGGGPCTIREQDKLINLFLSRSYPSIGGTMVFGTCLESEKTLSNAFVRAHEIDCAFEQGFGLAISIGARVYPVSTLGRLVKKDMNKHIQYLYPRRRRKDLLLPVIYCKPFPPDYLEETIFNALGRQKGGVSLLNNPL